MRKLFSLIAAVLFAGSMMADVVTINASDVTTIATGATSGLDVTLQGIQIVWEGAYYNNDQSCDMRVYASKAMTLTAGANITKVEIAGYCKAGFTATVNAGEVTTGASYTDATTKADLADPLIVIDNINATSVSLTAGKQLQVRQMRITLDGEAPIGAPKYYVVGSMTSWAADEAYELKANPGQAGEYMGEFTFAANDEFKVIGIVGGETTWYPGGTGNNYNITEAGDYKVFFRPAGGQPEPEWYSGYFKVIMKEAPIAISCAEVYNLAKNDEVALNDVVVTYANGKNVYVKDATGAMLLFLPTADAANWAAGDVLSGVAGVVDVYNGLHEVKPTADQVAAVTATPGEAPEPEVLLAAPTAADVNKYVLLQSVTLSAGTFPENKNMNATIGEETFVLRNNFNADIAFDTVKMYDITGVVAIYNQTIQLYFIDAEESGSEGEYTYDWEPTEAYQFDVEIGEVETIESEGVVLFGLTSADKQYFAYLMFFTPAAGIVAGTYPINTTMEPGTFSASPGGNDEMDFPCYFGVMDGDMYYSPFYMVSGSVTMNEDGMAVNATSYNGSTIKLTYVAPEEAIENTKVENAAVKFFENGQLIIEKNGVRFNAIGTRL